MAPITYQWHYFQIYVREWTSVQKLFHWRWLNKWNWNVCRTLEKPVGELNTLSLHIFSEVLTHFRLQNFLVPNFMWIPFLKNGISLIFIYLILVGVSVHYPEISLRITSNWRYIDYLSTWNRIENTKVVLWHLDLANIMKTTRNFIRSVNEIFDDS